MSYSRMCAPGFGQMLARPLFRERWRPDLSEEEASQLLHDGLRVSLSTHECIAEEIRQLLYHFAMLRFFTFTTTCCACCRSATTGTSRLQTSSR